MPAEILAGVQHQLRAQITSGMRWTLWLSILSIPFSFVTRIILARTGPEVIGTFGLLQVYIGITSVFLFFGGNAVAIRFWSQLESSKHFSFLVSYALVILAFLTPWLLVATLWQEGLRYLFGESGGRSFQLLLIYLSPLFIAFSLVGSVLKGMMEIKWAQLLDRMVIVGSFSVYVVLFFLARDLLAARPAVLIWGSYLALVLLAGFLGLRKIAQLNRWRAGNIRFSFILPQGFWRYAVPLQGTSILGFLSTRLDYLLILNVGGVKVLGQYVALMTLAYIISRPATFFVDSFLPALSGILGRGDRRSAREITEVYTRLIFPTVVVTSGFVLFAADLLLKLLGPEFAILRGLLPWVAAFAAFQALNWFFGTLLVAAGRTDWNAFAKAIRVVFLVLVFWPLWNWLGFEGALFAWGGAELLYHAVCLVLIPRKVGFEFTWARTYVSLVVVIALGLLVARAIPGVAAEVALLGWVGACALFVLLAGYSAPEVKRLVALIAPMGAGPEPSQELR